MKILRTKRFKLMLLLMVILILVYPLKTLVFTTAVDIIFDGSSISSEEYNIPAIEVGND